MPAASRRRGFAWRGRAVRPDAGTARRDAAPAFLDGAALESFENAESVREIGHELEAGKRGDLVL